MSLIRTGEKKRGVVGLFQPGISGEISPSLSVRWMGINQRGAAAYLISLYCSAAVLSEDAVGVLENVKVDQYAIIDRLTYYYQHENSNVRGVS